MVEAVLMLVMLIFILLLLVQAKRLTDRGPKVKPLLAIFEFKANLDKIVERKKGSK